LRRCKSTINNEEKNVKTSSSKSKFTNMSRVLPNYAFIIIIIIITTIVAAAATTTTVTAAAFE